MTVDNDTGIRFLAPLDLAMRWSISARTLDRWRAMGTGPDWHQIGGQVRYALSDVETWEARMRRGDSHERS
jgi:predicted DNA-binding transcriptional regulator AlpA